MRRFYARPEQFIDGDKVEVSADEVRHLRDALRLQPNAPVSVFDGEGREFAAAVEEVSKNGATLRIVERIQPAAPESRLDLTLAAALLKGEKFDLVVQKAVELGVSRLTPLITHRCDVKSKDPSSRLERWNRIALEACKQSGRAKLMSVDAPAEFLRSTENFNAEDPPTLILFSERGGVKLEAVSAGKKITAIVGPEGGWEDSELEAAKAAGASIVTFGGRILRAETAAIAAAAVLQHRFGDLN